MRAARPELDRYSSEVALAAWRNIVGPDPSSHPPLGRDIGGKTRRGTDGESLAGPAGNNQSRSRWRNRRVPAGPRMEASPRWPLPIARICAEARDWYPGTN
ncbi:hypothetical protein NDU88_001701 [Pleurodeles waltl]|uniref:Uncharacterized protein n=1 Tax=Pleurodeles waltl TaxID=8319 RepID=A0AAV7ND89_PLEWA|nr:hypothetical protein NDU88_001701 [Pleurodeles waltl]